jgi:uncharacterized protein (TIGR00661 family)
VFIKPANFPSNKKILYCCLNWGLGHATRSIPIIDNLIHEGNEVTIASDGTALQLLQSCFPQLKSVRLAPYNVSYPYESLMLNITLQSVKILYNITKEHRQVKRLMDAHSYDVIISDNRIGCHHSSIPSIYITHQLSPFHENGLLKYFLQKTHHYFYKKFESIWIPDDPTMKLSGTLSNYDFVYPSVAYTGIVSRLEKKYHASPHLITVLLSGPEPQRSYLETSLYHQLLKCDYLNICFIRGTTEESNHILSTPHISVYNLLSSDQLQEILGASRIVIARSGYTTLMDLHELGLDAILIPTPGQTEQEYLATLHQNRWPVVLQKEIETKILNMLDEKLLVK